MHTTQLPYLRILSSNCSCLLVNDDWGCIPKSEGPSISLRTLKVSRSNWQLRHTKRRRTQKNDTAVRVAGKQGIDPARFKCLSQNRRGLSQFFPVGEEKWDCPPL
jgi:hypothetical protein